MKKVTLVAMAAAALLVAGVITSCSKDEGATAPEVQQDALQEAGAKYVPFFELAKGDTVAKGIYREKPEFPDDDVTILFSSEEHEKNNPLLKAEGYSNQGVGAYIDDIMAWVGGSNSAPATMTAQGNTYYKIPVDLNEGAGGQYIFLYYSRSGNYKNGHVNFFAGHSRTPSTSVPIIYQKLGQRFGDYNWTDLNDGAGGYFIYLVGEPASLRNDYTPDDVIKEIGIVSSTTSKTKEDLYHFGAWDDITIDLNKGAGGRFIYLVWR